MLREIREEDKSCYIYMICIELSGGTVIKNPLANGESIGEMGSNPGPEP